MVEVRYMYISFETVALFLIYILTFEPPQRTLRYLQTKPMLIPSLKKHTTNTRIQYKIYRANTDGMKHFTQLMTLWKVRSHTCGGMRNSKTSKRQKKGVSLELISSGLRTVLGSKCNVHGNKINNINKMIQYRGGKKKKKDIIQINTTSTQALFFF